MDKETFWLWLKTYWGKPGYSDATAAQAMNLQVATIATFSAFVMAFVTKFIGAQLSMPTEQNILDAWNAVHLPAIYVPSPFGDVPEPIPQPDAPVDPEIGTLTVSELQDYAQKWIDARLEAHGLILKQ